MIEGAFAAHVGGVGTYAFINDLLYLESTGYKTLGFSAQNNLGTDPFGAPGQLGGVSPYWRVALEPHWGRNTLSRRVRQDLMSIPGSIPASQTWSTAVFPQTDKFTDIGFDTQYQYQGDNWWLTLRGSYIREFQQLDATFANGGTFRPTERPAKQSAPRHRLLMVPTTASYSLDNISIMGHCRRRVVRDPDRARNDARTPTAGRPRSLTSRSAPARWSDGRGSTPASACNTPTTTS